MDIGYWAGVKTCLTHLSLGYENKYGGVERLGFSRGGSMGLWVSNLLTED